MRLPPSTGPIWNLRLFRWVVFAIFFGVTLACLANLCLGEFKTAATMLIPLVLFGWQWHAVRRFTLLAERWATRHPIA